MKKLLPALLAILFLAACAPTSVESSAETANEENQTADNFERNLECQKYKEEAETRVKESMGDVYTVESIFYSPKQKSCIYVVNFFYSDFTDEGLYMSNEWWLFDFFTQQELSFISAPGDRNKLNEKIAEYQS